VSTPSQRISERGKQFVQSVLDLKPRVAVFDCDGTLWSGDAGADFFYWEIEQGLIPKKTAGWAIARYKDYKAGRVDEETMCGEMVTINANISEEELLAAGRRFFEAMVLSRIFPEMQQLTRKLSEAGCRLWAVSSTNEWVIRAGASHFGIPAANILAACVHCDAGIASDRLIRVPTDEGKAVAVREAIGGQVDTVFGNSMHDAAMLELAQHAYAINPNKDLEAYAREHRWTIYKPEA
jgi:phosphoserine phosphatase